MKREWHLSTRAGMLLLIMAIPADLAAQTPQPTSERIVSAQSRPSKPFRTPWGDPDLQGTWTNSTTTPLERPAALAGREFLTEDEAKAHDAEETDRNDRRQTDRAADVNAAYNQFWWERGGTVASRRTSLIVDPADGRLPPLTPEGRQRAASVRAALQRVARGPEDRNLAERCVTRGAPKLPGGYNNNFQILQTPEYVVILQEMIHEVRLIPLDGRPHLQASIRQWMGNSRAHWEGANLIVDTTNYRDEVMFNSYNCCPGAGRDLHIVERYTRTAEGMIDFSFTVTDPSTFVAPFTVSVPMTKSDGPLYEYACHEGNYGMTGILSGARAQERAEQGSAPSSREIEPGR
jgi:hypothetical protein